MPNPYSLKNVSFAFDARMITGVADGGNVTSVADQSPFGNDLTNPGVAPTLDIDGVGGQAAISIASAGSLSGSAIDPPREIWLVIHYTGQTVSAGAHALFLTANRDGYAGGVICRIESNGSLLVEIGDGTNSTGAANRRRRVTRARQMVAGNDYILRFVISRGAGCTIEVNGEDWVESINDSTLEFSYAGLATNAPSSALYVGQNAAGTLTANVRIGQLIAFSERLTVDQAGDLYDRLSKEWGVTHYFNRNQSPSLARVSYDSGAVSRVWLDDGHPESATTRINPNNVNSSTPASDTFTTAGGSRYRVTAYWSPARFAVLAIDGPDGSTKRFVIDDITHAGDNHNSLAVAVDKNGYIHVSGTTHSVPLVYYVSDSTIDLFDGSLTSSTFGGSYLSQVSYVSFFKDGSGELYASWRDGNSVNANWLIKSYNASTQSWAALSGMSDEKLIDGKASSVGVYPYFPAFDNSGNLFFGFAWNTSSGGNGNEDIHVIKRLTGGSWALLDGTSQTVPVTQANATPVRTVASGTGLRANSPGLAIVQGTPHIIYGVGLASEPTGTTWRHGYWDGSAWQDSAFAFDAYPYSRPVAFSDESGDLYALAVRPVDGVWSLELYHFTAGVGEPTYKTIETGDHLYQTEPCVGTVTRSGVASTEYLYVMLKSNLSAALDVVEEMERPGGKLDQLSYYVNNPSKNNG